VVANPLGGEVKLFQGGNLPLLHHSKVGLAQQGGDITCLRLVYMLGKGRRKDKELGLLPRVLISFLFMHYYSIKGELIWWLHVSYE
jgi:hypothetical protein